MSLKTLCAGVSHNVLPLVKLEVASFSDELESLLNFANNLVAVLHVHYKCMVTFEESNVVYVQLV